MEGLYFVPTPIGNLEDITIRGLKTLASADIIACEDTRTTGILLKHFNITPKKLVSLHNYNESKQSALLLDSARDGKSIAVVSDAGTPGISDPGFVLMSRAIENNIKFTVLPGATALIPAFVGSGFGLPFCFVGFPPHKKGRNEFITAALSKISTTVVFYESPHRLESLLQTILQYIGENTQIVVARELSKIHEEYVRGTVKDCLETISIRQGLKGEIVVLARHDNCEEQIP